MGGPRVAICVYNGLSMFEFGTAYEIFFSYAKGAESWYNTRVVSVDSPVVRLSNGLSISVDAGVEQLSEVDTIILPGWSDVDRSPEPKFIAALRNAYQSGVRIVSFCSGAFALAAAGILTGKKATTHWKYAERFKQRYPDVELEVNKLYVGSGNVYTSAGSAACIDLSIELIRQDFGDIVATKIAKRLVVPGDRPGGQQQFIELPVPKRVSELSKVMDWALMNLDKKLSTEMLAEKVHLSRRTFDRHFSRIYGMSLKQWLLNARLEKAKYLLETTELTVDFIALDSGFATPLSLRNHFDKYVGVSPGAYRRALSKSKSSYSKLLY